MNVNMSPIRFFIERLDNNAWVVNFDTGRDPYMDTMRGAKRFGFASYNEAEAFAVKTLRTQMREFAALPVPLKK